MLFFVGLAAWPTARIVSFVWLPSPLFARIPLTHWHVFHAAAAGVLLAVWLATRGRPLPVAVLGVVEAGGV